VLLFAWVGVYLAGATVAEIQAQTKHVTTPTAQPSGTSGGVAKAAITDGESTLRSSGKAESLGADTDGDTVKHEGASPRKPSLAAWVPSVIVSTAFFVLLYLSSAIGTGLRILVAFQRNQLTQLTGLAMFVEVLVALAVAFGLALFYMIGSISFTSEVNLLVAGTKNFATIAVSMSLLGLCAGYLVPIDKLHDRLQKIFIEEKNQ
jgi:hypothetical protein